MAVSPTAIGAAAARAAAAAATSNRPGAQSQRDQRDGRQAERTGLGHLFGAAATSNPAENSPGGRAKRLFLSGLVIIVHAANVECPSNCWP